jgi:plastocyanin
MAATAALLLAALGCGGQSDTNPAPDTASPPHAESAGGGVEVTGKVPPALAPPSSLLALESRGHIELPIKAEPAVMDQVSLEFLPPFLLAQAGQAVEFRNGEDVLHNIRVTEVAGQKPVFNVATPPGGKYLHKFERPGFYNVGCDIHQTMRADIFVMDTPYTATTGTDGSFTISNVKPGEYNLTVYAGSTPIVRAVEIRSSRTDLGVIQ